MLAMKLLVFILAPLFFFAELSAQDLHATIREADRLEAIPNEMAALNKFKEAQRLDANNVYVLSKCSELCSRIGSRETSNTQKRDEWFKLAHGYATLAIKADPLSDQANVSMAMILGKSTLTKSGKEKLKNARAIKKHLDIALKTNPNNYLAWHILGRWNYELSNVTAIERAGAKVFYGGIPEGTLKNAISSLEKARSLQPYFILNCISLATAYHKDGQKSKAIGLLKSLQAFPVKTEDDSKHKQDALKLVKNWE
jgi:regulator of microtubule dynamics RMD1/3-like protein